MPLTSEQVAELKKPLDKSRVQRREGFRGLQLDYLPTHDIVETANRIFGYGGWQREIKRLEKVYEQQDEETYSVGYLCEYRIRVGEIMHEDVGFGSSSNQPDLASAHEFAVKSAVSDALKRCFRALGDQFGLSLYKKHEVEEYPTPVFRAATEAQLGRLRKELRQHNLKPEQLLEHINSKTGSSYAKLEELSLREASRAIERFEKETEIFVKQLKSAL